MRVIIADGFAPFIDERDTGPGTALAEVLRSHGHQVEPVRIPRGADPVSEAVAARLTDVSDAGERLIALGRPAHLLRHPHKIIYCEGTEFAKLPEQVQADRAAFTEARRIVSCDEPARLAVLRWWDGGVLSGKQASMAWTAADLEEFLA